MTTTPPPPPTTTPPPPPPAVEKAPAPSCAGYCDHALRCMNVTSPTETASCISTCESQHPSPAKLVEMTSMTCEELVARMVGAGANRAKPAPRPGPAPGACTDCSGCYWEEDMCLYTYGYVATGIRQACKRCCCPGH